MTGRHPLPEGAGALLWKVSPPGLIRDNLVPLVLAWHERETVQRSTISSEAVARVTASFMDQVDISRKLERELLGHHINEMLNTMYVYQESKLTELITRDDYLGTFAKWVVTFLQPLRY